MSIAQLPQSTIKLITSSQVITSVSSAVKELIENSLDAGASNIDVKLDNYGLDRIEVKDDGAGISLSDAAFMALPHYTSKISAFSDIESLESYGFRGEALNALCQVGNVTVTTASSEDTTGTIYVLDKNGQVTSSKPTHKIKGTSIVVAYLFKNIPVRRQYFSNSKRAKEELRLVENTVKTLGVINPTVRFTLHHNKCMIWQKTSGTQLRQGVVYMVGYSPARELHELKLEGPEVKIEALVPRIGCDISILSKGSPDWSMVFINKRPVESKSVYKVVCEYVTHSFGERALHRKSPIFLVSFTLSPTRVDVNLEPNKTRVLVKDEEKLLEELKNLLAQYYGNPAAKEESASLESPAKKRKLEPREELAPKPVEILFDNRENSNGGKFVVIEEQVQPKNHQNEAPAWRPSVQDKENIVEINATESHTSKWTANPIVEMNPTESHSSKWTANPMDQSITAEKWSMGLVREPTGNYYQGPAVFVPGQDERPGKERVQLASASTSMNSFVPERERQLNPVNFDEDRRTVPKPEEHFSSLELREFEKDWSLSNQAENSSGMFAPVKNPPPPVVTYPEESVVSPPKKSNEAEHLAPVKSPLPRVVRSPEELAIGLPMKSNLAVNSSELFAPVKSALPPVVRCPEESLISPPAVPSFSEQLGPVIDPPRPRNEKKNRKTLQLAPRDDEIDMSVSSQMGRREFAGFTKFARDTRPQIILENPGIAFTKVAAMLADMWKVLPTDQREMYEDKAREHILARKQMQRPDDPFQLKLSFEPNEKPSAPQKKSSQRKTTTGSSKPSKPNNFHRSQTAYRVSTDLIKERSEPQSKRKSQDNYSLVGHLEPSGGWVCLKGSEISLVSPYRLQEVVLTHRLLATHTLPLRALSSPHRLEEADLGADNWNLLLSMDRIVSDVANKQMVVSSPIIVKNGFRIQLTETEEGTVVSLTHVAETISFYGIQDLLETLLLAATNGTSDLTLCRPLRVVNHIKGEAVRICRQDPSVMERQVLEELLLYWRIHLSPSDLCLHSKPIWTPIHSISVLST